MDSDVAAQHPFGFALRLRAHEGSHMSATLLIGGRAAGVCCAPPTGDDVHAMPAPLNSSLGVLTGWQISRGISGPGIRRHRTVAVRPAPEDSLNAVSNSGWQQVGPLVHGLVRNPDRFGSGGDGAAEQIDGFRLQHSSLNHSSLCCATVVTSGPCTISTMVKKEESSYAARLKEAMGSTVTEPMLVEALGITRQAVTKVLKGKSSGFNTAGNVKAARLCGVSSDWLATGEGDMVPLPAWPFPLVDRARFDQLDAESRGYVQKAMNDALSQCEQAAGNVKLLKPRKNRGGSVAMTSPFTWSAEHHPSRRATDKKRRDK